MKHRKCGGRFVTWTIREHNFCYMECDRCLYRLGGEATDAQIKRLMQTKVSPTIRRA